VLLEDCHRHPVGFLTLPDFPFPTPDLSLASPAISTNQIVKPCSVCEDNLLGGNEPWKIWKRNCFGQVYLGRFIV
jgi:hypothetical protein